MLLGRKARSEATLGRKTLQRVSFQECPTGLVPQAAGGDSDTDRKSRKWRCLPRPRLVLKYLLGICIIICRSRASDPKVHELEAFLIDRINIFAK
jgi:hypothetical protein